MKRSTFLASVFGFLRIAQAQQGLAGMDSDRAWAMPPYKPLNNQCPVCGTMARPYTGKRAYSEPWCEGAQPFPPTKEMLAECQDPPRQRIVRCHRCNAAFWQDAV